MTQLIYAMTPEYVVLASDRRLTYPGTNGMPPKVADDDACKLIFLCGRWGIAYTGLARVDGLPTDHWIVRRLAEHNTKGGLQAGKVLLEAANDSFRHMRNPAPLSIVILGWASRRGSAALEPIGCVVSNACGDTPHQSRKPGTDFELFFGELPAKQPFVVSTLGRPLPPSISTNRFRMLRRMMENNIGPNAVMDVLIRSIMDTAARDDYVGSKVLSFSIPRVAIERKINGGMLVITDEEPTLERVAFCDFDGVKNRWIRAAPNFVCGNESVSRLTFERDPDKGTAAVQGYFSRVPPKRIERNS